MGDLTTLAAVRLYLRGDFLDGSYQTFDAELARLIGAISADVRRQTDRALNVPAASVTERRHGDDGTRMLLREYPVASVTSVTVDGVAIPAQVGGSGNGWFLDGDCIELIGYTFGAGRNNVVIVYSAGWATVPADLAQAVIQLVALAFTDADHIGKSSMTVGSDSATFNGGAQLANASAIIERYARPVVG